MNLLFKLVSLCPQIYSGIIIFFIVFLSKFKATAVFSYMCCDKREAFMPPSLGFYLFIYLCGDRVPELWIRLSVFLWHRCVQSPLAYVLV